MKAVVFANGSPPSPTLAREATRTAGLTVAADGGADRALALRIVPDLVVGDLDSLSNWARSRIRPDAIVRDLDPDRTDLQKAIELCLARGAGEVDVLGVGGGRADHALANLSVLFTYRDRAAVRFLDDQFEITAAAPTPTLLDGPRGTVISLVAVGECRGVTTNGLRWDLRGATLKFSPLGVHNEIRLPPASVTVERGDLLVFLGRWVEKHG